MATDKQIERIDEILARMRQELVALVGTKRTGVMRYSVTLEVNLRDGGIGSRFVESHSFREGF